MCRRHPLVTATLTASGAVALAALGYLLSPLLLGPLIVAVYWLALDMAWVVAGAFAAVTAAALVGAALTAGPPSRPLVLETIGPVMWVLAPVVVGSWARLWRTCVRLLAERAANAERTRELEAAIRTVARGDALLSAGAARALITRFLATAEPASHLVPPGRLARLTPRAREIMTLAAEGRSNEEIAQVLAICPLTVRTHVHHAMAKLGARDRAQLVVIAYQSGLLRPARSSSDRTPVIPPPAPSAAP
ncbi:membrane hypothetical protein [Parafrankia sp. Ea1.12]|uniref:helix-turn-helix transcriptional regulator n=1 Tax=Parafrankia sp. Ea1.12 TaxID=573499 RepID=UPI000DA45DED|nr:response regulator transcription factor [Parafrankia sp. Ea1.12]SQD98142.1 Transcriptional regulatory protein [Parafrankia sp. Ea1.12]SQD98175.1 membrane hypothetical protein [Parafrankia sp. Ea1.12]